VVVVDVDAATATEFYELGEASLASGWPAFRRCVLEHCTRGDWLTLSGSLPVGVDPYEARELVKEAQALGAFVAVDHDGPVLKSVLAAQPSMVKVNQAEAREATGAHPPDAVWRLSESIGGGPVIVTLGVRGAFLLENERLWHGDLNVNGRYPTGCGDAFLAGVMTACSGGEWSWPEAFAFGLAASAANAEQPGAGSFDVARARALAKVALTRIRQL
jgi:1-phosphofructokinase